MCVATNNDFLLMQSLLYNYFTDVIFIQYVEACVTVVEHFGRIQCLPDFCGAVKPGDCSSVDWQELEVLYGFKINCNPSIT